MKEHLNDGQLRASLDGELAGSAHQHLDSCAVCQSRLEILRSQVKTSARKLAFLVSEESERAPLAQSALKRFYSRKLSSKENPMLKKLFASPAVRFVAISALVLTLIVSIPATRALADQLLSLFRVQQVTVIPVDFTGMEQLTGGELGKQFSELISNSMTVTKKPSDPVSLADASDASAKAGFTVRLPQSVDYSRLTLLDNAGFEFTIDRTKAQALLDESGRTDLVLPNSTDGAVISVNVPASVLADYGTCPDPAKMDPDQMGTPGRNYPDCIILTEIPSPTVSAPADVDVAQLAQIGLEFTGMTSDEAAAYVQTVDWTSTLVVPIPKNAATYSQVQVDDVTGTLIQRPADDAPQFVLIWVKDGIIYAFGGLGTNSQQALDMANSLP
ncbi:MAG TPA: hypothetical protein VHM28_05645 [Anaerolineales bacterium]|nr:hypothetical protein [Anaerolineales bacterium]